MAYGMVQSKLAFVTFQALQLLLNVLGHRLCGLVRHYGLHVIDIRLKG
jgi:hypothetical protein